MKNLTNFHVLTIKYSGATNTRGSRVIIRSDRFKKSIIIGYNYEYNNIHEIAQAHLESKGFEFIGKAEGKDCYYLISTTFNSPTAK